MDLREFSIRRASQATIPGELRPLPGQSERRFRLNVKSEQLGDGRWMHRFSHEALNSSDRDLSKCLFVELEIPQPVGPLEVLDPFVMMLAFRQMTLGGVLEVAGPVSRRLLRNLIQIQALSHNRWPDKYLPFGLEPDEIIEAPYHAMDRPSGVIAVTGGLDSTLTLYRETDPQFAEIGHSLGLAITVVGYNPGGDRLADGYENRHMAQMRRVCARRSLEVAAIRTDLWRIPDYVTRPHGAVLGGILALTAPAFSFAILASSTVSGEVWRERGCAPEWQWSYGTGGFDLPTSLSLFTRAERLVLLSEYGASALDDLIVCGTAENLPDNCGQCAKCVRTMLTFEAAGLPIPQCFPAQINEKLIGYGASKQPEIGYYAEIMNLMDALGTNSRALRILRRRYRRKALKRKLLDFLS